MCLLDNSSIVLINRWIKFWLLVLAVKLLKKASTKGKVNLLISKDKNKRKNRREEL